MIILNNRNIGDKVKFNYADNIIVGTLVDVRVDKYLVDITTINNEVQTQKTFITVNTTTILDYLFKDS